MNKVILKGRLTADPEIRRTAEGLAIARFTLAVDRRTEGADFPSCNAFGRTAEFIEKYFSKGMAIICEGRIQTGSYTNKDGHKVYTTDVIVENCEFCEKKQTEAASKVEPTVDEGGFMSIPDGIDEELPFN